VLDWILGESNRAVVEDLAAVSANETCGVDEEEPVGLLEPELTIVRKTAHPEGLEHAQRSFQVWVLASKAALNRRQ
jgi:hypothetical protein